jgi:hypothetical protein
LIQSFVFQPFRCKSYAIEIVREQRIETPERALALVASIFGQDILDLFVIVPASALSLRDQIRAHATRARSLLRRLIFGAVCVSIEMT